MRALIIDGDKVESPVAFDVIDPATGAAFASCPQATPALVDRAVAAAARAQAGWAGLSVEERARCLEELAEAMERKAPSLAALLSREQGKPTHVGAAGEIAGSVKWLRETAKLRLPVETLQDDPSGRIELHRKPLGVVASITPWNFPVMIAVWHFAPALLTGNTVIIKPSSFTPLTTLRVAEIAADIFPRGVLNVVAGDGGIGGLLTSHSGVSKVVFTGSTPTGRKIMAAASGNLKRLTLELGGNDAGIVLEDADVDAIAPKIFQKAFGNSGQICAALKRLYIHESIHDRLAERLAEMARSAVVGPGDDQKSQFGPLQNKAQFDFVCELADDARARGGRFLVGGEPMAGPGYFFPLSVAVDVSDGMRIVDEEQFGPLLPAIKFADEEDALARANANPNGLGGSVWSSNIEGAAALARRLECGTTWVNDHSTVSPTIPFGGAKQSGVGVEFGVEGLREFTQVQVLRTPAA